MEGQPGEKPAQKRRKVKCRLIPPAGFSLLFLTQTVIRRPFKYLYLRRRLFTRQGEDSDLMGCVISSALSRAWNYLAADRRQDYYLLCSPVVPRDAAWSEIRVGMLGLGG